MVEDESKSNTKQTLDDENNDILSRTPKLLLQDHKNDSNEQMKIQTAELMDGEEDDDDDEKAGQSAELGRMSHLDSQKSYRDLVIGKANEGQPPQKENSGALGQDASGSGHPVRENCDSQPLLQF